MKNLVTSEFQKLREVMPLPDAMVSAEYMRRHWPPQSVRKGSVSAFKLCDLSSILFNRDVPSGTSGVRVISHIFNNQPTSHQRS